mgnify:CR=1 FL=1
MPSPILKKLINQFQFLPGIGEKTAQRFVHHIFSRYRKQAADLAATLIDALEKVDHCEICHHLSEEPICHICSSPSRDRQVICVVEHPANIDLIESTSFKGTYFVLHGALSPIDGITPHDLGLPKLLQRIKNDEVLEILIATSSKIEGEATAYYIHDQFSQLTKVTRLAYGIPIGGSLDYIDGQTLSRAIDCRQEMTD